MNSNILKYKGQIGSIEHDLDRGMLYGKLLFINDFVNYEAESLRALEQEFQISVDEYLADCTAMGIEPNKPFKGSFNVRIGRELHKKLALKAADEGLGLNEAVQRAVEQFVVGEERY
ncbi:type II toxin-antitoxin system HicB family antitoxin [Marinobacter hydrocarbonoclasticus]|uniref:type II toxin-antitoxin system HicB family antitoxin n=1 Tax=Marinobacter nauticus TaxID=2743 RepID=UPI001C943644|nr:type II toxin-antitoxin system HicB family antitoxin [Marinobacter nauticus]MBY6192928.1 type II toxin-antitoxin system HicB family antitoxin [Marinobacter nauticus]MBY6214076.1 type II toxin-antitoxin system HicB family antitoxin [Marinobacter nauticus]